ncbi:MAG: NAD(P)-dependent alcohol dehydrogenase [SAR202 cluster bacterium]|nr:NAD(P)-dependent alcohol dehydrogenase [SAR202 cluster bacterium]
MKAVVQSRYGPPGEVLQVREIEKPTIREDEVLVRVRAASVHADVWHVVTGQPYVLRIMGAGIFSPGRRVPGTDLAGTVEAVGVKVSRVKPGDAVFGESQRGMQWKNGGTFAEYAAAPESALALKPAGVTFEQAAAAATAGYVALTNLRGKAAVRAGQDVLINGAAGGVGAIAVQFASAQGAKVTGVDRTEKLELMRALGADRVIDHTKEDFTAGDERYDLIFDVASTLSLSRCKRVLRPEGVYVFIGHDHYGRAGRRVLGSIPRAFGLMFRAPFDRHIAMAIATPKKQEVMAELAELLATGKLRPVVARTFPLESVGEAIRDLQEGRVPGRIILTP